MLRNKKSFNTLGLTFALWSMFGIYFIMWNNATAAVQQQPVPLGPGVEAVPEDCPNYWLPEPSPELDQILAAQASIAEKVFTAGSEDFRYCMEGGWYLESDFYEMKVTDFDIPPIPGKTNGGEPLTAYLFLVLESPDLVSFDLSEEELQWAEDHDYSMYIVGGVVETDLGFAGFYALAQQMDMEGERINFLLPFEETTVFDYIYSRYTNPDGWKVGGSLEECYDQAESNLVTCLGNAKIDYDTCLDNVWDGYISALTLCGLLSLGIVTAAVAVGCALTAVSVAAGGNQICLNNYNGAVAKCYNKFQQDMSDCARIHGAHL